MESTTFTALAERAGRWWTVRVPQIDGLAVQVRSLDQAEIMARQRIAEALHLPPESIRVEVRTDSAILPAVTAALQARQAAALAAETANRATRAAIEELLADGTSFHEATVLLGLSPEEVAQLTAALRGASQPGPSQPGPSQPGPSQPGPSQHGPTQHGPTQHSPGPYGAGGAAGAAPSAGGRGASASTGRRGTPAPERPVGPSGLPMRTRSAGPMAVHH
jgi:hypothetical protein